MPENNPTPAIEEAYGELLDLQLESRKRVLKRLARLDMHEPDTLAYVTRAMLQVHFEPSVLAEIVGTSRTTISRWANNQTISRSAPYRLFAIDLLKKHLADSIENPVPAKQAGKPRRPLKAPSAKPLAGGRAAQNG